jgi:hypothetical protein
MGNLMFGAMACLMAVANFASADIVWVFVNDPGVSGHEGFTGYMSKYETTNAQYCEFLNAAKATGDVAVSGNDVIGASGSNSGGDFVGEVYYDGDGPGSSEDGATNGGAARINYTGGVFSVDSGFEDHPVTYVSWYGATAFCNYYAYRLPTEWEWQAVADYDGSFVYGCGTSINNTIANYVGSTHPDGTTPVGAFGTYSYGMCDMAGNVLDWTSTTWGDYYRIRGGGWNDGVDACKVSYRGYNLPDNVGYTYGFRACYSVVLVSIDIKPGSCPNPLNVKDKGLLSVAILGSEDFDVWTIDVASIRLEGVAPVRSIYEDVATPMTDGAEVCECTTAGPDDHLDLTLKFNVQDIVAALGQVNNGDELELILTGALDEVFGGTPIEGTDCIVVQGAK